MHYKAEARVRCVVEIAQLGKTFLAKFDRYPAIIGIINMKLTSRLYILSALIERKLKDLKWEIMHTEVTCDT